MKKPLLFIGYVVCLLTFACEKSEDKPTLSGLNDSNHDIIDFSGDYMGSYIQINLEKATGLKETNLVNNFNFIVNGNHPRFKLTRPDSSILAMTAQGTGISSLGGTKFFKNKHFFGSIDEDLLTLKEIGENDDYSWTSTITASR